jgi:outer membrane protein OmpA-like peptidoglycan-associated protein
MKQLPAYLLLLCIASLLAISSAQAADKSRSKVSNTRRHTKKRTETRQEQNQKYPLISVFASPVGGAIMLRNNPLLSSDTQTGYVVGVRGYFDFAWPRVVASLGLGWYASRIPITPASNTLNNSKGGVPNAVVTSFADVGGALRYQLPANLQIGPNFRVLYGSDSGFSPREEVSTSLALYAGAELMGEVSGAGSNTWQYGLQFYRDINLSEQDVFIAQAFVGFGFPLNKARPTTVKTTTTYYQETKNVTKYRDHFFISVGVLNFVTGSYDLPDYTREYLSSLGQYLQENPDTWENFHITSHTDVRGTRELNERLSANRGKAILDILVGKGVSQQKIEFRSLASSDPVESSMAEVSLARNRRVEISISGGEKVKSLESHLLLLKLRFLRIQAKCHLHMCR